jgi:hypothetical protein
MFIGMGKVSDPGISVSHRNNIRKKGEETLGKLLVNLIFFWIFFSFDSTGV